MYQRIIKPQIEYWLNQSNQVIILYGARQVGKTTLALEIAKNYDPNYIYVDCEAFENQEILNSRSLESLKRFVGSAKLIVFDEAQKVQYIGVALKLLHDHVPGLKIIATGSSSFELANKISEPLTGRNVKFQLYPLSLKELAQKENMFALSGQLKELMRFGSYPKVAGEGSLDSQKLLKNLAGDYLYRDAVELGGVRKINVFKSLLRTLAYLIGQTVTYTDIAKKLETDRDTVERYMELLEKTFIIKILRPLHRSHVREILHPFKVYFWDLGIRNALIDDFKNIELREDKELGALWENFCIVERIKLNEYGDFKDEIKKYGIEKQYYFWRTKESSPKEYDLVEDYNGEFEVFEMKWSQKKESQVKKYPIFFETYPKSTLSVIHNENWWQYLV